MIHPDPAPANRQQDGEYGSENSEFSDLMAELKSYQPTAAALNIMGVRAPAGVVRLHAAAPCQPLEIATADWDILFRAVEERLRLSVGERLAATARAQPRDAAGRVQAIVLECVAALDKLHIALKQERHQRDEFEQ